MTLPASGPISIAAVAAELGISQTGLSLNDSRVRGLAQIASGGINLSSLYSKTGRWDGVATCSTASGSFTGIGATLPPFFGSNVRDINLSGGTLAVALLANTPVYGGYIQLINHSTGVSTILTPVGTFGGPNSSWINYSPPANIAPYNVSCSYSLTAA
jgi:hypothetical protein